MVGGVLYTTAGTRRDVVAIDAATGETLWMWRFDEGDARRSGAARTRIAASPTGPTARRRADPLHHAWLSADRARREDRPARRRLRQERHRRSVRRASISRRRRTGRSARARRRSIVGDVVIVGAALQAGGAPKTGQRRRATSAASTCGPASGSGPSTPSRSPASSATRPGRTTRGATPATPACGRRCRPTKSSATSTCRSKRRPATSTAAIGPATTCSPTASSASTRRPASASGTSRSCITTSGTTTPVAPPILSTSPSTAGRSRRSRRSPSRRSLYVFDRVTGKPVWPIEERPVPQARRAGRVDLADAAVSDQAAAVRSAGRHGDDLIDFTPELKAEALKIASRVTRSARSSRRRSCRHERQESAADAAATTGGANWQGGAVDPETGILYVASVTDAYQVAVHNDPSRSNMNFICRQRPDRRAGRGTAWPRRTVRRVCRW